MIRIENWAVVADASNPYTPPECIGKCLVGEVFGHPRFPDGSKVQTGQLIDLDLNSNRASTESGSEYSLGKMDPSYESYVANLKKGE
jgi:hypothetical protein